MCRSGTRPSVGPLHPHAQGPGHTLALDTPKLLDTLQRWAASTRTPLLWIAYDPATAVWSPGLRLHEAAPNHADGTPALRACGQTIASAIQAYETRSRQDVTDWGLIPVIEGDRHGVIAVFMGDAHGRRLADAAAILSDLAPSRGQVSTEVHDQLVAAVRHEIRGPLTVLRGVSSQLSSEPDMDVDDRQYFVSALERESIRVTSMVEDLLCWWRLAPGAAALNSPGVIDLTQVVETVVEATRAQVDSRGLTLETQLSPVPSRSGDPALCAVMVRSIITDALAAVGNDGRVTIVVEPDDGQAKLVVTDNGPAPPTPQLQSFRRSTSAGKHTPGVGIGLPLAKRIADAHGWTVQWARTVDGSNAVTLLV